MKAKGILIKIIIVLVVLGALGGTFAVLWFNTNFLDFMKPAEQAAAEKVEEVADKLNGNDKLSVSNILNVEDVKFSDYSKLLKEYKEMSGKPVKSKLNITANVNISELDNEAQNIINKSKITMESSADPSKKSSQNKIGLYSGSSEVLTVDVVTNDKKIGIGCDALYDKYLTVSMDELIDYLKKNNSGEFSDSDLEMLTKLTNSELDVYDLLYISDEDLKSLDKTYGNLIGSSIPEKCITNKDKVSVKINGKSVDTTATYVTLTGEDAYKAINSIAKTIKNDNVVSKILTEKANIILEQAGQDKIKQSDIKNYIDEFVDEMLSSVESIKDEDEQAVQLVIYSDGSKTVKVELNSLEDVSKDDKKETLATIEYADSKNIYTVYNDGSEYFVLTDSYTKNTKEERAGTLSLSMAGSSIGTANYELINKSNEEKISLSVNIPLAGVSGKFEVSSKGDYTKEPVDVNGVISFKYGKESAEVKFDGTMEYGNVSIPTLSSSNSVNVLSLSEEEQQKEAEKILEKAAEVLPDRLKLIGINITKEDILGTTPTEIVEDVEEEVEKVEESIEDDAA